MANEVDIRAGLNIRKTNADGSIVLIDYQSRPNGIRADMAGDIGPTPGAVTVSTSGTNISLSALTAYGGWAFFMNYDDTNFVEYGIYDGADFHPLGELQPGEFTVLRLSRNILYGGTGTALVNNLRFRADTAACVVFVGAFDA